MKILLTGATGFLGQYVLKNLINKGHEVVAIVREKKESQQGVTWIVGDLKDVDFLISELSNEQINCCVHLAWEGIPEYSYPKCEKSFLMGMNILRICASVNIQHLVVSGSCCEYSNPHGKIAESWKLEEREKYAASKNALRFMMRAFCNENGMIFNWLRLFYVIGVGQRETSLIPSIVKSLKRGNAPIIKKMSNANDFIDVEDVAEAFAQVVQTQPTSEILNVGVGKATSVKEILKLIGNSMEKELILQEDREDTGTCFFADIETITTQTKWRPLTSLEKTIRKMVIYYEA